MIVPLCLALLVTWTTPVVAFKAQTTCPSASEVAARLSTLLPPEAAVREPDLVELDDDGAAAKRLHITLRRPDGSAIACRWQDSAISFFASVALSRWAIIQPTT